MIKINRTNHTGFVVKNLKESLKFYQGVMGMNLAKRIERTGIPISQVVGYENCHLQIALLNVNDDGHMLELLQYVHPPSADRPTEERAVLGGSHLSFEVDDIHQTYRELLVKGVSIINPPVDVAPGRTACYLQDPEGNWLELMELHE